MIRLLLTGVIAAQAATAPPPVPSPSPSNCRAPDGRIIMKCLPRGTVVKMKQSRRVHASLSDMPAAGATPTSR